MVFYNSAWLRWLCTVARFSNNSIRAVQIITLKEGTIKGGFSKYVIPVIEAWYKEHKALLMEMWNNQKIEMIPTWE